MGRLNQEKFLIEICDTVNSIDDFDKTKDLIIVNEPTLYDYTDRVLLIDMDSIIYTASYKTEEDLEECYFKINNKIFEITLNIEKWFKITKTYMFIKGNNNFRYDIYKDYKANRPPKHPIINQLYDYCKKTFSNIVECHNAEADDYIYTAHSFNNCSSVIAIVDKDLLQMPGIFYLYNTTSVKKGEFLKVCKDTAIYNLATQCLIGDPVDNIKFSPGIGKIYAQKNLKKGMSQYSYIKTIYKGYLKSWKGDSLKAKSNMRMSYSLVKLKNIQYE